MVIRTSLTVVSGYEQQRLPQGPSRYCCERLCGLPTPNAAPLLCNWRDYLSSDGRCLDSCCLFLVEYRCPCEPIPSTAYSPKSDRRCLSAPRWCCMHRLAQERQQGCLSHCWMSFLRNRAASSCSNRGGWRRPQPRNGWPARSVSRSAGQSAMQYGSTEKSPIKRALKW